MRPNKIMFGRRYKKSLPGVIWLTRFVLTAAPKCRSCKKGRYAPPVHMIKLTEKREITPYKWVHPDEDR